MNVGVRKKAMGTYDGFPIFEASNGYVRIYIAKKEILFHIYVYEKFNGPILPKHAIHHINGIKTDNRIENLQMLTYGDHVKIHKGWIKKNGEWYAKFCPMCKEYVPLTDFYKSNSKEDRPSATCKKCHTVYVREWKHKNPDKSRAIKSKSYRKHKKTIKTHYREWYDKKLIENPDYFKNYRKKYLVNRKSLTSKKTISDI